MRKPIVLASVLGIAGAVLIGGVGTAFALPSAINAPVSTSSPLETVAAPPTDGPVPTSKPDIASITDGKAPTDDDAVAFLKKDVVDFEQLNDVYVRHATVGDLESLLGKDSLPIGYSADLPVILVTGVGTFHPAFNTTDISFKWGTMVIDATDGGLIGTFGQPGDVPDLLRPQR